MTRYSEVVTYLLSKLETNEEATRKININNLLETFAVNQNCNMYIICLSTLTFPEYLSICNFSHKVVDVMRLKTILLQKPLV